ncbi:MAG: hypothetical protein ACYS74_15340 [Planctomycetota bacterium]|jgi:hypothetical protein
MTKRYYKYAETHRTFRGRRQKYCTTCKQWKAESEFRIDRDKRDGLKIRCRGCDSAYEQEYREKHKGDVREYLRFEERHRTVKGVKQKLCCSCRQWKKEAEYYELRSSRDGLSAQCKKCSYKPAKKSHK